KLQAISTGKVPGRTGHRNTQFPPGRPNITATFRRLEVGGTESLARSGQRIRPIIRGLFSMLATNSEGERTGRQIPDIAIQFAVFQRQRRITTMVGGHEY